MEVGAENTHLSTGGKDPQRGTEMQCFKCKTLRDLKENLHV